MTTADVIWGNFRPGFFDPAPLDQLAGFMRDGKWLSLQTENGKLERVRITEIRVYVKGEDIVLRQEWLSDVDGEFRHRQVTLDSESIWRATPVKMNVSDVKAPVAENAGEPDVVFGHIMNVLVAETGLTTGTLTAGSADTEGAGVNARHSGIVMLYEMTDLGPVEVCKRFGYQSQQPYFTARSKMGPWRRTGKYEQFVKRTRHMARKVWVQLGRPARRTPVAGQEPML